MSIEAWIVATPAVWTAIAPAEGAAVEPWHRVYTDAVTGFFKNPPGKVVYNVIGAAIPELIAALNAHTPGSAAYVGEWGQGSGNATRAGNHFNVPSEIIAAQLDIVEYDIDGNPTGSTPPTLSNPNYGHVFLGQKPRRAGGAFSKGFSKGFL